MCFLAVLSSSSGILFTGIFPVRLSVPTNIPTSFFPKSSYHLVFADWKCFAKTIFTDAHLYIFFRQCVCVALRSISAAARTVFHANCWWFGNCWANKFHLSVPVGNFIQESPAQKPPYGEMQYAITLEMKYKRLRYRHTLHGRNFVRHLGICHPNCVKLLQLMSVVITHNLVEKRSLYINKWLSYSQL